MTSGWFAQRRADCLCATASRAASFSDIAMAVRETLAVMALVFGFLAADMSHEARAETQCTGVPHDEGGRGSEFWNFHLDTASCNSDSISSTDPINGFSLRTSERFIIVNATHGSVGTTFSSCTTTTDNDSGITSLDYTSSACVTGGGARFTANPETEYTFTMVLVGSGDGIVYTVVTTMTALYGSNHGITAMSISGGVFDAGSGEDASDSQKLTFQQASASNLVVNFQTRSLGDVVFGSVLDSAFTGGGVGPEVSASGFSTSTRGMANWLGDRQRRKLESQLADLPRDDHGNEVFVMPVAALMPTGKPKWNAWLKGNWTFYDGKGSSFDGHMIDVLAGVDYRVAETVVMGLLAGYGNADFNTEISGTRGAFKADGYTVGPYIGVRLSETVQFDALAAYTFSDYDNRSGAVTGTFAAHRVTVGMQVKGTWHQGAFHIEPTVGLLYAEEYQDAYTDSAAARQTSLTVRAGRVSIGPKIGYLHATADGGSIQPWVAVKGEYDFSNQGGTPSSDLPDLDDVASARVSLGIDASTKGGLSVSVQGDVSGLGSNAYTAWGGTGRIDVPF